MINEALSDTDSFIHSISCIITSNEIYAGIGLTYVLG